MVTTIGQLANVPAPGAPVASPWAQDVTRLARHYFASAAALLAQWPDAPDGAHAICMDSGARVERRAGGWYFADPLVGTHGDNVPNAASKNFTLPFGATFLAAPHLLGTVMVGGSFDLVLNWAGAVNVANVSGRVAQSRGSTVNGAFTVYWVAFGYRAVAAALAREPGEEVLEDGTTIVYEEDGSIRSYGPNWDPDVPPTMDGAPL